MRKRRGLPNAYRALVCVCGGGEKNCILAMKNRQEIRPKRPEMDIKLKI